MIDLALSHLARRSMQAHQDGEIKVELPAWAIAFLVITSLFFFGLIATIRYTYGEVIAALLMVESPSATLYVIAPKNDNPDAPLECKDQVDPERLMMIKEAPITSSIFKAEKHLVLQAGSMSRFRGISIALVQNLVTFQLANFIIMLLPPFLLVGAVASVISQVLVARIATGWTHIVISEPSSKYWFKRIPSFSTWKKVAVPTLILSVAKQIAVYIPMYLARTWAMHDPSSGESQDYGLFGKRLLVISALGLATTFLVVIPAQATLTRVQASLLPESDETIVPFDRSFGGKVIPEIVGGSGMVGMLDAWKTFGIHARISLVKLYVKVFVLQSLVVALWAIVTVGFVMAHSGPDFTKALANAQGKLSISA